MTEEETESFQPLYDPKAARWFLGRLSAPTLRQLALKLPEGSVIADYYPMGYAATRDGVPIGRAELRTTYGKPKFHLRPLPATTATVAGDSGCREMVAREPVRRPRTAVTGQVPAKLERSNPSSSLYKTAWSEDEMLKLRTLAEGGKSAQEIANATGRSRNAVIGQCHRCGVKLLVPQFHGPKRGAYDRK